MTARQPVTPIVDRMGQRYDRLLVIPRGLGGRRPAAPRPWLAARLLVKVTLGLVCGTELVLLLWVIL